MARGEADGCSASRSFHLASGGPPPVSPLVAFAAKTRNLHRQSPVVELVIRAAQEMGPCHGETSPNIPGSKTGKRSVSSRATRAAAFHGRRSNVAPGPRSKRTTAVERRRAARAEKNRLAIPPRTRAAGLAAPRRPRDRRRADRQRPKKQRPHASETTPPRPTKKGPHD